VRTTALARALALLEPPGDDAPLTDGYLDLLAAAGPAPPPGLAQRLMLTGALPRVYERWWRRRR
jgi:hypothetical protein